MESAISLLSQLLECWYSDVTYTLELSNNNKIEIDTQEIKNNYWDLNINLIIYDLIYKIAEEFIRDNQSQIEDILNVKNLSEYRDNNELYEIFTNYIDSHLWFKNQDIQNLFEQSRFDV